MIKSLGEGSSIGEPVKIYEGAQFRPGIVLIMEENTFIGNNCTILVPKLVMRKGSQICAGTVIAGRDEVVLNENVVVGYNCVLLTASDTPEGEFMNDASPKGKRVIRRGPIILKKNCFIGSLSLIMPNVVIEEGVVVRARSYVDKNLNLKNWIYNDDLPYMTRKLTK